MKKFVFLAVLMSCITLNNALFSAGFSNFLTQNELQQLQLTKQKAKQAKEVISVHGNILIPNGNLYEEAGDILVSSTTHPIKLSRIGSADFILQVNPAEAANITVQWKLKKAVLSCQYTIVADYDSAGNPLTKITGSSNSFENYSIFCTPESGQLPQFGGLTLAVSVRGPRGKMD